MLNGAQCECTTRMSYYYYAMVWWRGRCRTTSLVIELEEQGAMAIQSMLWGTTAVIRVKYTYLTSVVVGPALYIHMHAAVTDADDEMIVVVSLSRSSGQVLLRRRVRTWL